MDHIPIGYLFLALLILIVISAFFSGSETGLLTINRYRLKHLAKAKHAGAIRVEKLLEKPDRLIGIILLGNNFVNILASAITTVIALRLLGEYGIAVATGLLTLVILIFAEVTPKTLAILYPEKLAFPASWVFIPLLKIFYPFVWIINTIANRLLRLFGVSIESTKEDISKEELRTVVLETGSVMPIRRQMLLNLIDLERITVEDIMIPRNEISGIDLEDDWDDILQFISNSQYTKIPVYTGSINQVDGVLHLRSIIQGIGSEDLNKEKLISLLQAPYFIPEATKLTQQLFQFQAEHQRLGLVVNEYGDIQGLVTLEDILEEIVGDFTSNPMEKMKDIHPQSDGSYLLDGTAHVRDINRVLGWKLPTKGPKTLNGLVLEYLETIPEPGTSLLIMNHPVEIVQVIDNIVKVVRVHQKLGERSLNSA